MSASKWRVRRESDRADRVTISLPDEIDLTNAQSIADALARFMDGCSAIVIDMTTTTFCDSAGVAALVAAHRNAAGRSVRIGVACAAPEVRRIFELSGIDQLIDVFAGLADARAATFSAGADDADRGGGRSRPGLQ